MNSSFYSQKTNTDSNFWGRWGGAEARQQLRGRMSMVIHDVEDLVDDLFGLTMVNMFKYDFIWFYMIIQYIIYMWIMVIAQIVALLVDGW